MVLAGSINGVVLVTHVGEFNGRFVGLWNLGVNRWKLIRINREGELSGRLTRTNVGLGYDKSSDDFKIIRIVTESDSETDGSLNGKWDQVDIYNVNKDSWQDVYIGGELLVWSCQYNCNFIVKIVLKENLQHRGSYLYNPKANSRTHLSGIDRLQLFSSESYSHSEILVTIKGMELIRKNRKNKKMNSMLELLQF
ncbi:hypothetical protein POM88_052646 [Heracleum sosnowskyi]|uniref:Uncharacterized protein n=1 Tax=Heracleum sosnowskyi TaxID=360622 RepID=A0AAD8GQR1_9APIA|nr:hypothetical protein POM88_052646 [Heracleum sosnowskyi]